MAIIQFFAAFHMIWIDQHQFKITPLQMGCQCKPVVSCGLKPYHDAVLLLFDRQLRYPAQKEVKTFCTVLKFDCLTQFKAAPVECSCPMELTGDIHTDYHCCVCDLTDFLILCYTHFGYFLSISTYVFIRALTLLVYFDCKEVSLFVQTLDFGSLQESCI